MSFYSNAALITGLYNTGQGGENNPDLNYSLLFGTAYVSSNVDLNPSWDKNDLSSSWITPFKNANTSADPVTNGNYIYMTGFDLTGDPATAFLEGQFESDNFVSIYLNGVEIASSTKNDYKNWTDFSTNANFKSGINILAFDVVNVAQASGNPTGLRVRFCDPVSEPDSYLMIMSGIGLLGFIARRKVV